MLASKELLRDSHNVQGGLGRSAPVERRSLESPGSSESNADDLLTHILGVQSCVKH